MSASLTLAVALCSTTIASCGISPAGAAPITVNCPTDDLQEVIGEAVPRATLHISGTCAGIFTIDKELKLTGKPMATLQGAGGTVLTIGSKGDVRLSNIVVTGGAGVEAGGVRNDGALVLDEESAVMANTTETYEKSGSGIYNTGSLILRGSSSVRDNRTRGQGSIGSWGGGIFNSGTLTMSDRSSVHGNWAGSAGGIHNSGTVTMNDRSEVRANRAYNPRGGTSGGIHNAGSFTLNDRASVTDNSAEQVGGGITNDGTLTLNGRSTVANNTAFLGAGIYTLANSNTVLNDRSSMHGNAAIDGRGGAVYGFASSSIELNDSSTMYGNRAFTGGAVAVTGVLTLGRHASITGNFATMKGGGVCINSSAGAVGVLTGHVEGIAGNVPDDVAEGCADPFHP